VLAAGVVVSSLMAVAARNEARRAVEKTQVADGQARAAREAEGKVEREAQVAREAEANAREAETMRSTRHGGPGGRSAMPTWHEQTG
jgi:hypothetical protein